MNLKRTGDRSKKRKRRKECGKFISSFEDNFVQRGAFWIGQKRIMGSVLFGVFNSFLRGKAPFRPTLIIDFDSNQVSLLPAKTLSHKRGLLILNKCLAIVKQFCFPRAET
jgi:hypothetical protein